jgi:predicted metalloprotease
LAGELNAGYLAFKIRTENQADCVAGAFMNWAIGQKIGQTQDTPAVEWLIPQIAVE